jgi:hypothetical protein
MVVAASEATPECQLKPTIWPADAVVEQDKASVSARSAVNLIECAISVTSWCVNGTSRTDIGRESLVVEAGEVAAD